MGRASRAKAGRLVPVRLPTIRLSIGTRMMRARLALVLAIGWAAGVLPARWRTAVRGWCLDRGCAWAEKAVSVKVQHA